MKLARALVLSVLVCLGFGLLLHMNLDWFYPAMFLLTVWVVARRSGLIW